MTWFPKTSNEAADAMFAMARPNSTANPNVRIHAQTCRETRSVEVRSVIALQAHTRWSPADDKERLLCMDRGSALGLRCQRGQPGLRGSPDGGNAGTVRR